MCKCACIHVLPVCTCLCVRCCTSTCVCPVQAEYLLCICVCVSCCVCLEMSTCVGCVYVCVCMYVIQQRFSAFDFKSGQGTVKCDPFETCPPFGALSLGVFFSLFSALPIQTFPNSQFHVRPCVEDLGGRGPIQVQWRGETYRVPMPSWSYVSVPWQRDWDIEQQVLGQAGGVAATWPKGHLSVDLGRFLRCRFLQTEGRVAAGSGTLEGLLRELDFILSKQGHSVPAVCIL